VRNPELAATRAELDGRWRKTIGEDVGDGQERGDFEAAGPEAFAGLLAPLLGGLAADRLHDTEDARSECGS
jgi:BetI-type transcriptional repressor, C-terminal